MTVRHKSLKISIKESMAVLDLPLIVLWQNGKRYIFILDTGATASLVHSKCIENGLVFKQKDDMESAIYGYGGSGSSSKTVTVALYYKEQEKDD